MAIQRTFRGHLVRARLGRLRAAAVALQAAWRRCMLRRRYLRLRSAAVSLQAAERGRAARREVSRQRQAIVGMQACFLGLSLDSLALTVLQHALHGREGRYVHAQTTSSAQLALDVSPVSAYVSAFAILRWLAWTYLWHATCKV